MEFFMILGLIVSEDGEAWDGSSAELEAWKT